MKSKQRLLVVILLSIVLLFQNFAEAIQPLKNLRVSIGADKFYTINDVSTVDELVQSLRRRASLKENNFRIIHNGRILNVGERLRDVGVLDGSRLVVLTDTNSGRNLKTKEAVALLLAMVTDDGWKKVRRQLLEHPEVRNEFHWNWGRAQRLASQDVYAFLKNGLDQTYHGLRNVWERPSFRASLTDPEKMEVYRKLVLSHLSPEIMNDIPWLKKTIHSRTRWRNSVTKVVAVVLRTGDVVLDGILALLLDVLEGNGRKGAARTGSQDGPTMADASSFKESTTTEDANFEHLLFELSDSESDD